MEFNSSGLLPRAPVGAAQSRRLRARRGGAHQGHDGRRPDALRRHPLPAPRLDGRRRRAQPVQVQEPRVRQRADRRRGDHARRQGRLQRRRRPDRRELRLVDLRGAAGAARDRRGPPDLSVHGPLAGVDHLRRVGEVRHHLVAGLRDQGLADARLRQQAGPLLHRSSPRSTTRSHAPTTTTGRSRTTRSSSGACRRSSTSRWCATAIGW